MKQPIKVVMLPTEDMSPITWMYPRTKHGYLQVIDRKTFVKECVESQHIYITISQAVEPIKEGDWVYEKNLSDDSIYQIYEKRGRLVFFRFRNVPIWLDQDTNNCRKIIATTDPKLKIGVCGNCKQGKCYDQFLECESKIPQLQQSFLKEYVANPDGDYAVEYEILGICLGNDNNGCFMDSPGHDCGCYKHELKLNQDCTVNITAVEEKVYSKYEVMEIAHNAFSAGSRRGYSQRSIMAGAQGTDEPNREDWIKENL